MSEGEDREGVEPSFRAAKEKKPSGQYWLRWMERTLKNLPKEEEE